MRGYLLYIFIFILTLFAACKKRLVDERLGTQFQIKSSMDSSIHQFPYQFVTDLEGKKEGLLNDLASKGLQFKEGQLHFIDPKAELFIGGDLSDRGTDSIKIRRMIADLKSRHPDRVHIVWGNRELNKLGMLYVMPLIETLSNHNLMGWFYQSTPEKQFELLDLIGKYSEWLITKGYVGPPTEAGKDPLKEANTPERRVEWFFEEIGCKNCLEYHQQELSELSGREVSRREAAEDYLKSLDPKKGEFYKFLEMGKFAVTKGRTIMVHGQINMGNFGIVPGRNSRQTDVNQWVEELNSWGAKKLADIKKGYKKKTQKSILAIKELAHYSDTVWDYGLGKGFANEASVVYAYRQKERNNFRLPEPEMINTLRSQGYSTLIVGHSPAGNIPLPLKADDFLQIMGDTSYGKNRSGTVSFDGLGQVRMQGTTGEGHKVTTEVSPYRDSPIGKTYKEASIIGEVGGDHFLTFRYTTNYKFEEVLVPKSQIDPNSLRIPFYNYDHTKLMQRGEVIQVLADKDIPVHKLLDLQEKVFEGRRVVFISSENIQNPLGEAEASSALKEVKSLIDKLDPKSHAIMTNGSLSGIEAEINRHAKRKGFQVVGAIAETAVPQNLSPDITSAAFIAEGSQDKGLNLMNYLRKVGGLAVFIGGGPQVAEQIDLGYKLGVEIWTMLGVSGASNEFAVAHAKDAQKGGGTFTSGVELAKELQLYTPRNFLSPITELPRSQLVTSTLAREFFAQQGKEVVTIEIPQYSGERYFGPLVQTVNKQLSGLDPRKDIVNIGGNSALVDQIYQLVKGRGFTTVKLVPIKEFSLKREYHQNIDHVLVLNDYLQVEKVHHEVVEEILGNLSRWDRSKDVSINSANGKSILSINNPISPSVMEGQLAAHGKTLRRVVITPEFLSNYPGPVVMGLARIFDSYSRKDSAISIEITGSDGSLVKSLTQKQQENLHLAYRLAKEMGFKTARVGDANNIIFKVLLPITDYLFVMKSAQDRLTSVFKSRIKKTSMEEVLNKLGRVIVINERTFHYHTGAIPSPKSIGPCSKLVRSYKP